MHFLTNKKLPRRTFLRGMGATIALPFLESMLPARGASRCGSEGAANAFRRCVRAARRGAGLLDSGEHAGRLQVSVHLRAAGAVPQERDHHQRHVGEVLGESAGRDRRGSLRRRGVSHRREAEEDHRRGHLRRHQHRSGHRAEDRQGQPPALLQLGLEDPGANSTQLRRRLQLRLHQHDFLAGAGSADADGDQSADGVRAHVRRRQLAGAAQGAPRASGQHPRLRERAA